jgi:hypothetical protein
MTVYKVKEQRIIEDWIYANVGDTVYPISVWDYGCAHDDTMQYGTLHISVTKDKNGGYPFFTIPFSSLIEVKNISLSDALQLVEKEVKLASELWPSMNSAHEAFAVLQEEVDELWDYVKTKQTKRNLTDMQKRGYTSSCYGYSFCY